MATVSRADCFQLKADFLPITILKFLSHDITLLQSQLENVTQKAPQYFANTPVIIDFSGISEITDQMDVEKICALLRQYQLQPIAARGLKNQNVLPLLSEVTAKPAPISTHKIKKTNKTKMITKPVRAGTQIYAKDSDLIVMASVNAGAEVIADGNIHIYAPLRGRALAGANGDLDARIFCKQLEAELVSVAGHYLLNEKMKTNHPAQDMVQIYLVNNKLQIEVI